MADILLKNCCGVSPNGKFEGEGTIVIFCPKCGRKSNAIPVIRHHSEYMCSNRIYAESAAKIWNEEATNG